MASEYCPRRQRADYNHNCSGLVNSRRKIKIFLQLLGQNHRAKYTFFVAPFALKTPVSMRVPRHLGQNICYTYIYVKQTQILHGVAFAPFAPKKSGPSYEATKTIKGKKQLTKQPAVWIDAMLLAPL
jgi:hypothetical protein